MLETIELLWCECREDVMPEDVPGNANRAETICANCAMPVTPIIGNAAYGRYNGLAISSL